MDENDESSFVTSAEVVEENKKAKSVSEHDEGAQGEEVDV